MIVVTQWMCAWSHFVTPSATISAYQDCVSAICISGATVAYFTEVRLVSKCLEKTGFGQGGGRCVLSLVGRPLATAQTQRPTRQPSRSGPAEYQTGPPRGGQRGEGATYLVTLPAVRAPSEVGTLPHQRGCKPTLARCCSKQVDSQHQLGRAAGAGVSAHPGQPDHPGDDPKGGKGRREEVYRRHPKLPRTAEGPAFRAGPSTGAPLGVSALGVGNALTRSVYYPA